MNAGSVRGKLRVATRTGSTSRDEYFDRFNTFAHPQIPARMLLVHFAQGELLRLDSPVGMVIQMAVSAGAAFLAVRRDAEVKVETAVPAASPTVVPAPTRIQAGFRSSTPKRRSRAP